MAAGSSGPLSAHAYIGSPYEPPARSVFGGGASFDYSGFLHSSNVRGQQSMYLTLAPRLENTGTILTGKLEVEGKTFTNGPNPFTVEARSAYIATSPLLMKEHQVTLGRRPYDWSVFDSAWNMGLWQPRFIWDPLMPEELGRVGLFYTYENRDFRFLMMGSPLAAPEQSYPVRQVGTTLSGASPFWNRLPECVNFNSKCLPVSYEVEYPEANRFFLIPNAATQLRVGGRDGFWGSSAYAYTPLPGSQIAIQPTIVTDGGTSFNTVVHPTFPYHHLGTLEGGYQGKRWSAWGSLTRDIPVVEALPETWYVKPLSPRTIGSLGGSVEVVRKLTLSGSYLKSNQSEITNTMAKSLLRRQPSYTYTQAAQLDVRWETGFRLTYDLATIVDIDNRSTLVSMDIMLVPKSVFGASWTAGIGFDSISTSTGTGWIGQFNGDDRVRWRLAYVF